MPPSVTSTFALDTLEPDARARGTGAAGGPPSDADPVLRVLIDGMTLVRWLLARYASLMRAPSERQSRIFRGAVARRLCAELAVHMHVEEELLYPRLRDDLDDTAVIDRAEVEHECLREVIERLYEMDPNDPTFDARVTVLADLVDLHMRREMRQIFPLVRARPLRHLAAAMKARRDELLDELADGGPLRLENEEADPVGAPPR